MTQYFFASFMPRGLYFMVFAFIYLLNCEATKSRKIYIKVCLFAVAEIIAMLAVILITCMAIVAESVKLMPFSLVLFGFINSIVWMAYSLIYKINIYLFICSAIGAFLSASEIVIYALYRHKVKTCKVKSA
ncbi:bidirectional sugar transporter SWEET8-like [Brassica napus]|uniref:bidirectional sugar transporter SWEET8-like n=1 Tax=Brassica napus TaxID=3708 RepID=UPI0020784C7E|nr:bidirectional sugar transporter SWEET8-like [Brassica napus]